MNMFMHYSTTGCDLRSLRRLLPEWRLQQVIFKHTYLPIEPLLCSLGLGLIRWVLGRVVCDSVLQPAEQSREELCFPWLWTELNGRAGATAMLLDGRGERVLERAWRSCGVCVDADAVHVHE